jgi:hypothetical protein
MCDAFEFWNCRTLAQFWEMRRSSRVWNYCHALSVTQYCIFMCWCFSRDRITRPDSVESSATPGGIPISRTISAGTMYCWCQYVIRSYGSMPLISDNIVAKAKTVIFILTLWLEPRIPRFQHIYISILRAVNYLKCILYFSNAIDVIIRMRFRM